MRRHGSKDKGPRAPKGSSGKMRFHDEVKARHASYPPLGNVHMNSGIPMPQPMGAQAAGGMPQGEEMQSNQGGGVY